MMTQRPSTINTHNRDSRRRELRTKNTFFQSVCMYRGCTLPFMEVPMESGVQLGLGEGDAKSGSNVPILRYHRYRVTYAGSYSHTVCAFCSQLYSGQLRVNGFLM